MSRPLRRQAGVTLAEMCVVVAVLGIAAVLAVPSANPLSAPAVDTAAGEIASAMRFAQREAQRVQAWYVVKFDTDAQTLRVYRLTTSGLVTEDTSKPVLHPVDKTSYQVAFAKAGASASIASAVFKYQAGATTSYISFAPDGSPADIHGWLLKDIDPLGQDGTVTVRHGSIQRVVKVAAGTGRVTF